MYIFQIIDPRNPVITSSTLGIEVTSPKVAAMCDLGNIDPQHGQLRMPGGDGAYIDAIDARAACDAALVWPLPPDGTVLVTERPDLDSLAAMAVLELRRVDVIYALSRAEITEVMSNCDGPIADRISRVAEADAHTSAPWSPRPLPTPEEPWGYVGSVDSCGDLSTINAVSQDRRLALGFRVACVAVWLLGGEERALDIVSAAFVVAPGEIDDAIRTAAVHTREARLDLVRSLYDGRTTVELARPHTETMLWKTEHFTTSVIGRGEPFDPPIAIVRSRHSGFSGLGYCVAPTTVGCNDAFIWPDGTTTRKSTIAWWDKPTRGQFTALAQRLTREEAATLCDSIDLTATSASYWPGPLTFESGPSAAALIRDGQVTEATAQIDELVVTVSNLPANQEAYEGVERRWLMGALASVKSLLSGELSWGGSWSPAARGAIMGSPKSFDTGLSPERVAEIVHESASW